MNSTSATFSRLARKSAARTALSISRSLRDTGCRSTVIFSVTTGLSAGRDADVGDAQRAQLVQGGRAAERAQPLRLDFAQQLEKLPRIAGVAEILIPFDGGEMLQQQGFGLRLQG